MDGILVYHTSDAAGGIDVGVAADHRAGVQHGVAAYFNVVAQHCAYLLDASLDLLVSVLYDHQGLVGFHVGSDGAGSHMAVIAEDGIAYVVIVRSLDVIKKNDVFELHGVSYNAVSAY
jgi:hypothetical protein